MALIWTEDQELLREVARGFLDENAPISELRRLRDDVDPDGFSRPLWKEMAELGWAGIPFDEAYGGAGLGYTELGVVFQECGRTLAATPLVGSVLLGGSAIALGGDDTQREAILPPLCAGERLLAAALQEGAHHAPYHVSTRAEPDGDGWTLNGRKTFVIDGHVADQIIVSARVSGEPGDRDGLALFIVDGGASGLTRSRRIMVDGRNAAELTLNDVQLPKEAALGTPGLGADILDPLFDRAAACMAAEMLGGIETAFDKTLEYLKVREQFGVPIGSFQALKHRAAKMFIEVELSKSVVLEALQSIDDQHAETARNVSVAKAKVSQTAALVSNEGVQMHGGIGVTDEEDIGLFLKRARVQQRTFGDEEFHRDRFAGLAGY